MKKRDIDALEHMLRYCIRINSSVFRFGDDKAIFLKDIDFQSSVILHLFQIGELSAVLTDDFKASSKDDIDWRSMKSFRNMVAHEYKRVNFTKVWDIVKSFIPELESFCEYQLSQANHFYQDEINIEHNEDLEL